MMKSLHVLWAETLLEEAKRLGVTHIGIAPGARSAPLVVAASELNCFEITVHFDERALGFWAVGIGKATQKPALIITTSGTAVANILPAVIEASLSQTPMLVCTADRPHELHDCGANQTIQQAHIFGPYVRWETTMPSPTLEIPIGYVLSTMDYAWFKATQICKGPVHLNIMFREPLLDPQSLPESYLADYHTWKASNRVFTYYSSLRFSPDFEQIDYAKTVIRQATSGCFIVGAVLPEDASTLLSAAEQLHWPVFAEAGSGLSGVRHKALIQDESSTSRDYDVVFHVGAPVTLKSFTKIKAKTKIVLNPEPVRIDSDCEGGIRIVGNISYTLSMLLEHILTSFTVSDITSQEFTKETLKASLTEDMAINIITETLKIDDTLFCGNSLAIRCLTTKSFRHLRYPLRVITNRGASGIDGNIATIAGIQTVQKKLVYAILGDQTALHDLTSLQLLNAAQSPVCLFILNNYGGQIFSNVVSVTDKKTKDYFEAPHQVSFSNIAKQFKCAYVEIKTSQQLHDFLKSYDKRHTIIVELSIQKGDN